MYVADVELRLAEQFRSERVLTVLKVPSFFPRASSAHDLKAIQRSLVLCHCRGSTGLTLIRLDEIRNIYLSLFLPRLIFLYFLW
jgi:hypothetical protein